MAIDKIVSKVTSFLEKARTPVIPIPAVILACSLFKRPGASAMYSASNAIKRQSDFGASPGVLPDGSANMMNSLIYVIISEVFRELSENGVVEVVIPANSLVITGSGANAGGPVVINGTNTTPSKGWGTLRCNK